MNSIRHVPRIGAAVSLLFLLSACGQKPAGGPPGGMPPPEVAVVTVAPERLAITTELPGRVEAYRVAQVRARVPGIVLKRQFREGSDVKAGAVLYRIDPAPYKAAYNSAEAALSKAQANLAQAKLKVQRYRPLVETHAISKQDYDDAVTSEKQAEADVAAAKAARQTARLNLGYATVNAPIEGRIGRSQVTEGALVGQGEATLLATIQQLDPIYVDLTESSADLLRLRRALESGKLKRAGENQAKITLTTEDGVAYPHEGKLLFSEVSVDENTGAVTLRARFPNPDRTLLPGMYARARLEQAVDESAIMVPQQALIRNAEGASVMLVNADGKVVAQPVRTGEARGDKWVVQQGLKAGDRVIVEGLQKIQPGAAVKPVPWQKPAAAPASAAAPQPAQK